MKNTLSKLYRKTFCPNGIVIGDGREYVPGDDTRFMNWHITAKTNVPFVDGIRSDSGDDVIFAVDVSASLKFGTKKRSKIAMAMDIFEALSQLAVENNDRVGIVFFSDKIEKYLPPGSNGRSFKCVGEKIVRSGQRLGTNLLVPLRFLNKTVKKRSTIILICDTFCLASNRKTALANLHLLQTKHRVILLTICDDNDMPCFRIGKIMVEDAESGDIFEIDTDDVELIAKVREKYAAYEKMILEDVGAIGVRTLRINTKDSAVKCLLTLFRQRT